MLFYIFNYSMFNFIDPELVNIQKEIMEGYFAGREDEQSQEIARQFKEDDLRFTLSRAMFSFAAHAISGFILSFIVAGIARNK